MLRRFKLTAFVLSTTLITSAPAEACKTVVPPAAGGESESDAREKLGLPSRGGSGCSSARSGSIASAPIIILALAIVLRRRQAM
jgi:uncharacterized protein (TIGR03382 family)